MTKALYAIEKKHVLAALEEQEERSGKRSCKGGCSRAVFAVFIELANRKKPKQKTLVYP